MDSIFSEQITKVLWIMASLLSAFARASDISVHCCSFSNAEVRLMNFEMSFAVWGDKQSDLMRSRDGRRLVVWRSDIIILQMSCSVAVKQRMAHTRKNCECWNATQ